MPSLIFGLLLCAAGGAEPAAAGDSVPPSVARDLEILNRLLKQKKAPQPGAGSSPSSPATQPDGPKRPAATPPPPQPATEAEASRIAGLAAQLNDDDRQARSQARRKLVKIGRPAVPELIRALEYAEDRARVEAVEALGTIRDPRAAEPLAALLTVPSREIWGATRVALWRIGAAAVPALLEVLGSADPTARWRSVHVLGEIRDSAAVEPLVALLKKDRDTGVRMEIAAVLGRIRDRTSCDVLLDALHDW